MVNKQISETPSSSRHYFVDEGGDGTLFSRTGKVLVGTEGCSRFFILGLLDVPDPMALNDRKEHAGLQAVDYFIWALQRLYERGEDRYLTYLWQAFGLVHDIDDTTKTDYGVYYTQNRPLTVAALRGRK